jgi:hypothetical protein
MGGVTVIRDKNEGIFTDVTYVCVVLTVTVHTHFILSDVILMFSMYLSGYLCLCIYICSYSSFFPITLVPGLDTPFWRHIQNGYTPNLINCCNFLKSH